MPIQILEQLSQLDRQTWNRLNQQDNPFLRHEFLASLEDSGCCQARSGWQPQHILLRAAPSANGDPGALLGAMPMYLKTHSYGEYVFDWAWANAYADAGLNYYPKLVAAVPFSPVTGARLLLAPASEDPAQSRETSMIEAALGLAKAHRASSLHWLFLPSAQRELLTQQQHLGRVGSQFHWHNQGYEHFDHFLAQFSAQKRKKVKRERRYVRDAGIRMQLLEGDSIQASHWQQFYEFYHATIRRHGAIPYLNQDFFHYLGERLPQSVVLLFAHHGQQTVAGALFLRNHDTLYGRYWGSRGDYHSLHFETCYYRAIEYCIAQGLSRFEAGAQGEHKLSRGFLPTPTYSAHWLSHPEFAHAVADFLQRERAGVEFYLDELSAHTPYRQPPV